ncbi:hypothetical protein C8039_03810 [Halogeometricum sp. wsp3]|nr:hypothetical protein C8039_03810 [Halogeometricum sp. wsp3]
MKLTHTPSEASFSTPSSGTDPGPAFLRGETPLQHSSGLGLWLVNWAVTRYGGSFRISATEQGDRRA